MTNILDKLIEEKIDTAARIYAINNRRDDAGYFNSEVLKTSQKEQSGQ